MNGRRRWRLAYGACAVVVAGVMVALALLTLRLEHTESRVRAEADYHNDMRLALWRIDSWVTPLLAREAARPTGHYLAYAPAPPAYDAQLRPVSDPIVMPSPLFAEDSEWFPLYFRIDADEVVSPQLPTGAEAGLPEARAVPAARVARRVGRLERLRATLDVGVLRRTVTAGLAADEVSDLPSGPRGEYDQRLSCTSVVSSAAPAGVGRLQPLWIADPSSGRQRDLVFVRRVGDAELQGFVADWPRLRGRLLEEVSDLFPGAALQPAPAGDETIGPYLATLPVRLDAPRPALTPIPLWTPVRVMLLVAGLATALALIAAAVTLRKSIEFGERRQRFVSAVTHELRTPLTTFRMYVEMLADGMVESAAQRRSYLTTLQRESARLAALVENVLAYARLDEGRRPPRREIVTVDALGQRLVPLLDARAAAAGLTLEWQGHGAGAARLATDVEAVGQVLSNLVDNAGKYARNDAAPYVRIDADVVADRVSLRVRDHGPGISRQQARTIFRPFDRGERDDPDPVPGIGLGLALSRGLARDLGGELTLEPSSGAGACFRLDLPVAPA